MIDTTNMDTENVLKEAKKYAEKNNIKNIVVATTTGKTGVKTSEIFPKKYNIIAVSHSTGFKKRGEQELTRENKEKMQENQVKVFTGPMIFHTWNDYYRKKKNTITTTTIIADTLRMFGQGTKVAVEIAAMAADAGLIPLKKCLCIAGTGYGADTILLIEPENSRRFMNNKILDVIAKPQKI